MPKKWCVKRQFRRLKRQNLFLKLTPVCIKKEGPDMVYFEWCYLKSGQFCLDFINIYHSETGHQNVLISGIPIRDLGLILSRIYFSFGNFSVKSFATSNFFCTYCITEKNSDPKFWCSQLEQISENYLHKFCQKRTQHEKSVGHF